MRATCCPMRLANANDEGQTMQLTVDFNPQVSERLTVTARSKGVDPRKFIEDLVAANLLPMVSTTATETPPVISAKNAAAIATLNQWIAEDATDDPEEIRKADEEVAEFKRNMNANRAATGERQVFS